MSVFNIDYEKLREWLLPMRLRQPRVKAFVRVLTAPVSWLYGQFHASRSIGLYRAKHGQHVAHLEAVLNDRFDIGMRRITVEDAPEAYDPIYLYQAAEEKPVPLWTDAEDSPTALWTTDETIWGGTEFVVKVPLSIPYDVEEMKSLINYYKTPGMGYEIQQV